MEINKFKRIIVLGFPRSGTGSLAKKFDLGHEVMNKNGTSNWKLVFDYIREDGDYIIQVMRNPLDVISSNFYTMTLESLNLISTKAKVQNASLLSTVILGYIAWIEEIERIGVDEIVKIEDEEIRVNCRNHLNLTWEDLEYLPKYLIEELKRISEKYGY